MSSKPKLICFDWDGTLIDTFDKITTSIIETGLHLGFQRIRSKTLEGKIGIPFDKLLQSLYGEIDIQKFTKVYHEVYQDLPNAGLKPGAFELINYLKHAFTLAIVSNKSRYLLERELQETKLHHCFQSLWVADEYDAKPSPLMLQHAITAHHVNADTTWLVGDTLSDFYAAQNAQLSKVILLDSPPIPTWAENTVLIKHLSEISALLNLAVYE